MKRIYHTKVGRENCVTGAIKLVYPFISNTKEITRTKNLVEEGIQNR